MARLPSALSPQQGGIVFLKANDSKHTSRNPHIVVEPISPAKSRLRKVLHSCHYDDLPTNLAYKDKVVDNKFLFRPTFIKRSVPPDHDCHSDDCQSHENDHGSDFKTENTVDWQPLVHNLDEDCNLIPIGIVASQTTPADTHPEHQDGATLDRTPATSPEGSTQPLFVTISFPRITRKSCCR